jgi:26S proteasome regulatory subunit N3
MTVVVPPTKGSRSSGKDKEEDVTMEGVEDGNVENTEPEVDPTTKAIQGSSSLLPCSTQVQIFNNECLCSAWV